MLDRRPMEIAFVSPRRTQLNQILEPSPIVTSPITMAPGAIHTASPIRGLDVLRAKIFPLGAIVSAAVERPCRSLFEMRAHGLAEVLGQIELERVRLSCDFPLEIVHEVAPRADGRANAQWRIVRNTPRDLPGNRNVLAFAAHTGDKTGPMGLLGGEKPAGQ